MILGHTVQYLFLTTKKTDNAVSKRQIKVYNGH